MGIPTITIDLDKKCEECRKGGAVLSGICLSCTAKAMNPAKQMKSEKGRAVQARFQRQLAEIRKGVR